MPTITPILKKSTKKGNNRSKLRFYISVRRGVQLFYVSDISVDFDHWDAKKQSLKSRPNINNAERVSVINGIHTTKEHLRQAYENLTKNSVTPTSKALKAEMDLLLNPQIVTEYRSFFDHFDDYSEKSNVKKERKTFYKVVKRNLENFELHKRINQPNFRLSITEFSDETALEFERFLNTDYRGKNTSAGRVKCVRAFFNWLVKTKKLTSSPYSDVALPSEAYGTPYFLTIDERNKLFDADLSATPETAVQRDIFVFHCVIGCRVGDLVRLKKSNVINGAVEYIAGKTKDNKPKTIRVPLNKIGLEILERYKDTDGEKLLPFITPQKHNVAIKKAFEIAKIDRIVTIMCPKTRLDIQRPLYEVASSHLARRTLSGNIYKIYKDTKIVSSITGHSPNSKALHRYIDIDDDMKNEVVKNLE